MSLKVWLPLTGTLENKGISAVTATTFETPTYVTGKIGSCYQRANSNSQLTNGINLNSNLMDILGTQASIAVWVKPLGTHTHYNGTIASSGNWNAKKWAFGVSQDNSKVDVLCGSYNTYITCAVPVNEWTHLVSTFDNGTCKLYKNGEYVGQLTGQKAFETDATNACIARETYASGYFGFNGCVNDVRIYDHCLSAAEVHEISQGLVLHYKLDQQYLKSGTNLVTDVTKGGQTTKLTDGRLGVITSGTNADTYFTINLSESITNGTTYHFSCDASGITEGRYWNFPLGAQGNSSLPCKIYNGHNEYVFTANDISWGSNRLFMDDIERSDWSNPATFYNFVLTKNATYEVKDSSGYGHNGTVNGTLTLSNNTSRYSSAIYGGNNTTSVVTTWDPSWLNSNQTFTCNVWINKKSQVGSDWNTIFRYANSNVKSQQLHFCYKASSILLSRYSDDISISYTIPTDQWIMLTWTGSGRSESLYINGEFKQTVTHSTDLALVSTAKLMLFKDAVRNNYGSDIMMSDFRIYCTALSAADVKQLYEVGAKVDNLQNLHTFEYIENNTSTKLTKQGQFKTQNIQENISVSLPYDKTLYTEPDGSTWVHVFHHNNPAGARFSGSADDWINGKYIDADKWYWLEQFLNYTPRYEFMVKQKTTSDATETKFRWIQTPNPLTTTWTDVKPGTVTFITTSGYSNNSMGGMYLMKNSSLHMCIANGSNGNWFGGIGAAGAYNGGIPGYPNTTITTGYIDLYLRIYPNAKIIKELGIGANNLIEK